MKRLYYAAFGSLLVVIFLFFQGCGDTNVFDGMSDDGGEAARIEQVKLDLNSGDYDAVIAALGKPGTSLTEQESRYLASAYMGKAGFDTLKLLEEIAKEDDGQDVEAFDVITRIFDEDGNGKITHEQLDNKITLINQALGALGASGRVRDARFSKSLAISSPSDDVKLQRGICAAIHAIFTICQTIACQYGLEPIPLTLKALKDSLSGQTIALSNNTCLSHIAKLGQDLGLVQEAVDALGGGTLDRKLGETSYQESDENSIQREFNAFLGDIGYNEGTTPKEVTSVELSAYLNQLLSKQ